MSHLRFQGRIKRGRVDWVASHLPFGEAKITKLEKVVNIMEEVKANSLERYLIVVSTLWHC